MTNLKCYSGRAHVKKPRNRPRQLTLILSCVGVCVTAPISAQDAIGTCGDLPDKLEACEQYSCEFTHPFTGEEMMRSIEPAADGMCSYHETMPNNGEMNCEYDQADLTEIAEYYRVSFESPEPVEPNALEAAMADGRCVISGY